jgi:serine/threonine protein kinase
MYTLYATPHYTQHLDERGFCHRDLKCENVMVGHDGYLKVRGHVLDVRAATPPPPPPHPPLLIRPSSSAPPHPPLLIRDSSQLIDMGLARQIPYEELLDDGRSRVQHR